MLVDAGHFFNQIYLVKAGSWRIDRGRGLYFGLIFVFGGGIRFLVFLDLNFQFFFF